MKQPRYVISESTGYRIADSSRSRRPSTAVLVCDSAYCFRVVWSSWTTPTLTERQRYARSPWTGKRIKKGVGREYTTQFRLPIAANRAYAVDLAARLNREHDAWLSTADSTPGDAA